MRSRKNTALFPGKAPSCALGIQEFVTTDTSIPTASRYSVSMSPRAVAQPNPAMTERFAPARSILEQAVRQHAFPGAAWGVLHPGATVALDAVGRFTYEASAPAIQPETVFDLASLTKVIATTAAAMLLVDRGLFDLDERLGDILPGFVIGMEPGSGKQHVTLRMLLAHTSGLPAYATLFREHTTPAALLRAILRLPLEAKPGARTEYSDFGFILLGKVVEVLSAEPLDAFCAREIFAPLGVETTRFCPPQETRHAIPPTEDDLTFRGRVIQGEVQDENCFVLDGVAGHAGVFANVADLLRFAQCILGQGRTQDGKPLFQPATVSQFATRQGPPDGNSRALGWDVPTEGSSSGRYFGPRSIGHLGYSGCSLWMDPDQELAVALLTNRTWPDRSNDAIRQVRPAFHNAVVESLRG
jgi:CubicO group peptidase (beta-lactamase class C family)